MNLHLPRTPTGAGAGSRAAFTLTELQVAMAIFLVVLLTVIIGHVFGLRMFGMTQVKLSANDQSRRLMQTLFEDIRSGRPVVVGSWDGSVFTPVGPGMVHQGTAIEIRPSTDPSSRVRYYKDPVDLALKRWVEADGQVSTVAEAVGNNDVFRLEDHSGVVLTNARNNHIVAFRLEFLRLQDPPLPVGPGEHYGYYELSARITPRSFR